MHLKDFLEIWENEEDRVLVHTSGSTGKPKEMWVEKDKMRNSARITCDFLGIQSGDSAFLCLPLDYIAGKMMTVRSIERELRLVCVEPCGHPLSNEALQQATAVDFHTSSSCSAATILAEGIDFAAMVPMQVFNSLSVPEERERLGRIKNLIIGGGAIDEALAAELMTLPEEIAVWSTYGMTETLSHIALRRLNGPDASEWYHPFDSVKVEVNREGCLVIDAPLVCAEKLVTNDIAELKVMDASESWGSHRVAFRIKGRKDFVICSGGVKIQIEEVEDKLRPFLSSPFMITKKKDEKFGEMAVLVSEDVDLNEVERVCKEQLPKFWVPKQFIHVDKISMTETGKVKRGGFFETSVKSFKIFIKQ